MRAAIAATILVGGVSVPDTSVRSENATSRLVRTIDTSLWQPPSPDPSGLTFLPDLASLMVSDGEVNETPLFAGDNLFSMSLSGALLGSTTTFPFSDEPTGVEVTYTLDGLKMFVTDDAGGSRIYVVNAGIDRALGTADDAVDSFRTNDFGSSDPEGVAFGYNTLFIADGVSSMIYRIRLGPNGKLDGVDDRVGSFDTESLGLRDPEGIAYSRASGHLYIVGHPSNIVIEVTNRGVLVQTIDIAAANARNPAGITYGPSSANPKSMSFYIADRGKDNNNNPDENDGRIYEMTVPAPRPPVGSM